MPRPLNLTDDQWEELAATLDALMRTEAEAAPLYPILLKLHPERAAAAKRVNDSYQDEAGQ